MRDEIYQANDVYYYTRYLSSGYTTGYDTLHYPKSQYRSDILPGDRRGDGFRKPTSYSSFFGRVQNRSFDYTRGNVQVYGRSSTGSAGFHTYGQRTTSNTAYGVPLIPLSMRNRCDTELLNKLTQGDLNLGVALGELPQTVGLLVNSSLALLDMVKALKRGEINRAARAVGIKPDKAFHATLRREAKQRKRRSKSRTRKTSSSRRGFSPFDAYLSMQYGWKPLVNDIHAAVENLQQSWTDFPPLLSAKRTIKAIDGAPTSSRIIDSDGTIEYGVTNKVYYRVDDEFLYTLNSIGLINPASVLWELIPYSFIVDWLVPVGNVLKAFTDTIGLEFHSGHQTRFVNADWWAQYQIVYIPQWEYDGSNGTPPELKVDVRTMQREILYTFPSPKPYYKIPGLVGAKLTTLWALLEQRSSFR